MSKTLKPPPKGSLREEKAKKTERTTTLVASLILPGILNGSGKSHPTTISSQKESSDDFLATYLSKETCPFQGQRKEREIPLCRYVFCYEINFPLITQIDADLDFYNQNVQRGSARSAGEKKWLW